MQLKKYSLKKMMYASICLALCLILPFLTGQIPYIGNALSPMHLPVLICGFICGWQYGLIIGFFAPLLRFVLFGMPPIFPIGIAMAFELATYGFVTGLLYRKLPKTTINIYISLVTSMLIGRIVWGISMVIITSMSNASFTFEAFIAAAFINALPGILMQILLIPFLLSTLLKSIQALT